MTTQGLQNYSSVFDKFSAMAKVPSWLTEIRSEGFVRLEKIGFPHRKDEDWRYTNIKPIAESQINLPVGVQFIEPVPQDALNFINKFENRIVFLNGWFSKEHSNLSNIGKGIVVGSLIDEIQNDNPALKEYFSKYKEEDAFTSLNKAFSGQGAYIHIEANACVEQPIHILYLNFESGSHEVRKSRSLLVAPHNFINLEKHSKVTVLESYISFDDSDYFTNAVTDILVKEGAHLKHCKLQAESQTAFHVGSTRIVQEKDSHVETFSFSLGSKIGRNNLDIKLSGEGVSVFLDGLYAVKDKQLIDNHTSVDHAVPHALSRQLYKGILDGEAHAVFNGKVIVAQDAQQTDSGQLNKNLILSKKAVIDTKPELKISANDVKCTHGATIGQLSEEEIFYFASRAIPEDEARRLLIHGFTTEVLDRIQNEKIREVFGELLEARFFKD